MDLDEFLKRMCMLIAAGAMSKFHSNRGLK